MNQQMSLWDFNPDFIDSRAIAAREILKRKKELEKEEEHYSLQIIKDREYKHWTPEENDIIIKLNPLLVGKEKIALEVQKEMPYRTIIGIIERTSWLKFHKDKNFFSLAGRRKKWTSVEDETLINLTNNVRHVMSHGFIAQLKENYFPDRGFQALKARIRLLLNLK